MSDLVKKIYLTEAECSLRYGLSKAWFQRARYEGSGPKFLKINAKVLYPVDATDEWFLEHGLRSSTKNEEESPCDKENN